MCRNSFLITILLAVIPALSSVALNPKREFRGAWMHTVHQGQYARMSPAECREYLCDQLDRLQAAGINAVFFQVRPSADALYASNFEPWSRFLTKDGKAPSPFWDPLEFMCAEAHARGMELHAWLNPYRVTTAKDENLPKSHIYHKHPERFVRYEGDGKLYFDPAMQENRDFIVDVVCDIVNRYDVDGIHFDDYFYPYPANGKDFGDNASYKRLGNGMNKDNWRRENVDRLIEAVHKAIRSSVRPWVRFGVSPFGIWRNKDTDPRGSDTHGLQNYDDLYADPLLWAEKGWIDYLIPQLYWELDHKRASTRVLAPWWEEAVHGMCQLYIGQDVKKCVDTPMDDGDELVFKINTTRNSPGIQGNCWWPGYQITANYKDVATRLASGAQSTIALVPSYPDIPSDGPSPVRSLSVKKGVLSWKAAAAAGDTSDHARYVVYRFPEGVSADFNDASFILAVLPSSSKSYTLPSSSKATYYVTALDHANNESIPSRPIVY